MKTDLEQFFEKMKAEENALPTPPIEEFLPKKNNYYWLYGMAATISLLAILFVLQQENKKRTEFSILLNSNNSPTVTEPLAEPETVELLEWEAPTDYLSNDFN
jgi:hypothetical protein